MKTAKNKKLNRRDLIFYSSLIAWPVIQFLIFYIGVNLNSFALSFQRYDVTTSVYHFAWDDLFVNFKKVFANFSDYAMFSSMAVNSLIAWVARLVFGMTLGVFVAFYIYKNCTCSKFFKVMIMMPSFISSLIFIAIFKVIVDNGIPTLIEDLYGIRRPGLIARSDTTFVTVLVYGLWFGAGGSMLIYLNAMESIPVSVTEAAKLDGCGYVRELFTITVPLIWKTFMVFFTVSIAGYFTNSMGLYAFLGKTADSTVSTFGYYLYVSTLEASYSDYTYLSAMGLLFTAIALPITMIIRHLMFKYGPSEG